MWSIWECRCCNKRFQVNLDKRGISWHRNKQTGKWLWPWSECCNSSSRFIHLSL